MWITGIQSHVTAKPRVSTPRDHTKPLTHIDHDDSWFRRKVSRTFPSSLGRKYVEKKEGFSFPIASWSESGVSLPSDPPQPKYDTGLIELWQWWNRRIIPGGYVWLYDGQEKSRDGVWKGFEEGERRVDFGRIWPLREQCQGIGGQVI